MPTLKRKYSMKDVRGGKNLPFCLSCGLCLTILSNVFLLHFIHEKTHAKLFDNLIPGNVITKSGEKYVSLKEKMFVSKEIDEMREKGMIELETTSKKIVNTTAVSHVSSHKLSSRLQGQTLINQSIHETTNDTHEQTETKAIEIKKETDRLVNNLDLLAVAKTHKLKTLDHISLDKFTIRINTWRRNEQLISSINNFSKCAGVAQIQVIWCDDMTKPPDEVIHHKSEKVVVEYHQINTLNERFRITTDTTPTIGIFSVDDDVLFPCEALDSGFFKWIKSPDRIVGYDARVHVVNDESTQRWKYGYMSDTKRMNKYSMTLMRSAFIHRDYLDLYISNIPKKIFDTVSLEKNCEDIAMSFFVSALTNNQPPLLADVWATNSRVKLKVSEKISGGKSHKKIRDSCVNDFAQILGLKGKNPLKQHELSHSKTYFDQGISIDSENIKLNSPDFVSVRQAALQKLISYLLHKEKKH